jgi:hypothetical protein
MYFLYSKPVTFPVGLKEVFLSFALNILNSYDYSLQKQLNQISLDKVHLDFDNNYIFEGEPLACNGILHKTIYPY